MDNLHRESSKIYRPTGSSQHQSKRIGEKGLIIPNVYDVLSLRILNKSGTVSQQEVQTSDGVLYHPNGNLKIVPDLGFTRFLASPQAKFESGQLIVPESFYERVSLKEYSRKDLRLERDSYFVINRALLNREQAKLHPIMLELARDRELWRAYVDKLFNADSQEALNLSLKLGRKPENNVTWMPITLLSLGVGSGFNGGFGQDLEYSGSDSKGNRLGGSFIGVDTNILSQNLRDLEGVVSEGDLTNPYISELAA